MTEKESIHRIWEGVWSKAQGDPADIIESPYSKKAFAGLDRFVAPQCRTLLEAGCGTGRLCAMFARVRPHVHVTGVDASESSLRLAQSIREALGLRNLVFERADLFHLPYSDGHFDVVLSEGVIQHFRSGGHPSREEALREMIRVLAPGGTLIACTANWHCYPHTIYKWWLRVRGLRYEYGYEKSYTKRELSELLVKSGLVNAESTAYYPSHGFHRLHHLSGRRLCRRLWNWAARLVERIETSWLAEHFGFEIMVKATKPGAISS